MTRRPGNNPNRRIIDSTLLEGVDRAALKARVRYVGSGHHKRNPADYGFERTSPRPTKSLCDLERIILLAEAQSLLHEGIDQGLISEPDENGLPKFIWTISSDGCVFEAKTARHGTGEYHGYPLEDEDEMNLFLKRIGSNR